MNWLKKKIDAHNERLTYEDYEEHWTVCGWLCSLVFLTVLSVAPMVVISAQQQKPAVAIVGVGLGAFVVWWHFWHILH
jgi:hypothetical protein